MNGRMHVCSLWRNVRASLALIVPLAVRVAVKLFVIRARVKRVWTVAAREGRAVRANGRKSFTTLFCTIWASETEADNFF